MTELTEAEVVRMMREHLAGLFPKSCPNCQRRFASLREYVQSTQPIGATLSYDAEIGDWNPAQPIGTAALANCACGSTLMLSSDGMPAERLARLLNWARIETQRRGVTPQALLGYLRHEIRKQALATPGPKAEGAGAAPPVAAG